MSAVLIKYFTIVICSFYGYAKLLHIRPPKRVVALSVSFAVFAAIGTSLLRLYAVPLSVLTMVALFILFLRRSFQTPINTCITTSVLSFALAYAAFLLAAVCLLPFGYVLASFMEYNAHFAILSHVCLGFVQFGLIVLLFRVKRLRGGIPFLLEYGSDDAGVFISVSLLFAASFWGTSDRDSNAYLVPTIFIALCGVALLFWWRNRLTKTYLQKIQEQEMQKLQVLLHEKALEEEKLKQHIQELSKLIHRDNKLIPAMELAVREYLSLGNGEDFSAKGDALLKQLSDLSQERTGILEGIESGNRTLPLTEIPLIDTVLAYFKQKTQRYGIEFDVSLSGSIRHMVHSTVSESDLRTLLSDLIENAIAACQTCIRKRILVNIGIADCCYSIDVFDSGKPFSDEALANLGVRAYTSRAAEGGSGIGLLTAFEIIKHYDASFLIETLSRDGMFTKRVTIRWDEKAQCLII